MARLTVDRDKERLAVWGMITRINDTLYKRHFFRGAWMSDLVDYHVAVDAAMFEIECGPARASKLADYLGMPRETVRRSLHRLVKRGILRRKNDHFLMAGSTCDQTLAELVEIIQRTAHELPQNGE
jgi:predicted transcriptional regulator